MLHVHTDSRYCNSRKKNSERCRQPAGAGTDHLTVGQCRLHGGMMAPTRLQGARVLADRKARAALQSMAVPVELHPQEALLSMVWEAAGNVAWLGSKVQELEAAKADGGQSGVIGPVMSSTVQGSLFRPDRGRRGLREPTRRSDHGRLAGDPALRRLERLHRDRQVRRLATTTCSNLCASSPRPSSTVASLRQAALRSAGH